MATLELVAMDMKAQGMYVSRTLSYAGSEFLTVTVPLEEPVASQYADAARMWLELYREFMYAEEQVRPLHVFGRGGRRRVLPLQKGHAAVQVWHSSSEQSKPGPPSPHACAAGSARAHGTGQGGHEEGVGPAGRTHTAPACLLGLPPALLSLHVHGCQGERRKWL